MKAIKAKYSVSPLKVTMINLPRKKVVNRRKPGSKPGKRKALVFLPAGSTLNLA
jgi:ribosomal protein L23